MYKAGIAYAPYTADDISLDESNNILVSTVRAMSVSLYIEGKTEAPGSTPAYLPVKINILHPAGASLVNMAPLFSSPPVNQLVENDF